MRAMESKHFRPYEPEQSLLLPQNLGDWLPEDHLVFFVRDVVDQLDLSAALADYKAGKGASRSIPAVLSFPQDRSSPLHRSRHL